MENTEKSMWDAAKYKELNTYFRLKINEILTENPALHTLEQEGRLELQDIVNCMHLEDQNRWQEYLKLDQMKMQQDIQDHLEGKGTPFHPGTGFKNADQSSDEEEHLW